MIDTLTYLSGCDIPFSEGKLIIHHPTIKEIGLIGEKDFFLGCQILTITKDSLENEDKVDLRDITNFEILMSIMKDGSGKMYHQQTCLSMLFTLILPDYHIKVTKDTIIFSTDENFEDYGYLDDNNFEKFRDIIISMFCLSYFFGDGINEDESWMGETAKRIAEKLKERKRKLQSYDDEKSNGSIFSRYISILAVGEHKDMNSFFNYTIFQLLDEFQRYELKINFDFYVQAQMAGAKNLKDVDDWMKELHP